MYRVFTMVFATLLLSPSPVVGDEHLDATVAAPDAHAVVMENEHVRVISAVASAGHKSPMHSHPPAVVISMDHARVRLTNADGSSNTVTVRPGEVFWIDATTHEWELLAGNINAIAVEIKSAQADD